MTYIVIRIDGTRDNLHDGEIGLFMCPSLGYIHSGAKVRISFQPAKRAGVAEYAAMKVGRQVVSGRICLLRRVFSPKTFHLSSPVLNNADGNGNNRPTEKIIDYFLA